MTDELAIGTQAEQEQREVSRRLFGGIRKLDAPGGHQPTAAQLDELGTIKYEGGVVNSFCTGCGTVLCLNQEGGKALAQRAGVQTPTDWKGKYFEVSRCSACDDRYQDPELKQF